MAYIKQAIKLESNIVEQNIILHQFEECRKEKKPQLNEQAEHYVSIKESRFDSAFFLPIFFCAIGLIMLILIGPLLDGQSGGVIGVILLLGFAFLGIGCYSLYSILNDKKKDREYNLNAIEENKQIREQNEAAKLEYDNAIKEWKETNSFLRDHLNKPLIETKETLEKLYSLDIIYPKYRNLSALTSIYEYLESGRCTKLTGTNGAYNLYEDEMRKDRIISQLNTIIDNLEQIKQNQFMLYQQMNKILEETQQISASLRHIEYTTDAILGLTQLNVFFNSVTAENSAAVSFYSSLR